MSQEPSPKKYRGDSLALKLCVFATGLAGIVAEYVMATMASYLLGDAVLHFTLVISWMLFAMGLGSRLSRRLDGDLLDAFIALELGLSLLVAVAAPIAYVAAVRTETTTVVIYALAFAVALLVGLELPLAARLNDRYEELRENLSAVFEKDYYGALLGGLLFAFVGLPHLGLAYTPIALGAVNFLVALLLFLRFRHLLRHRRALTAAAALVPVVLVVVAFVAEPVMLFGEQRRYRDVVVHAEQTRHQRIVMTRFKDDHWLFLDGHQQFSSADEERYHEPLVHPAMTLAAARRRVLLLGAGDGLAAREVLAWDDVETLTLVDLDRRMTELARQHPVLLELNRGALDDPRVEIVHADAYAFLLETDEIWDVVITDFPDPRDPGLARLYSRSFYALVARHMSPGGAFVTQATSPFFARRAFLSILKTVRATGMPALAYHSHVPTMGEWGFVLALRPGRAGEDLRPEDLGRRLLAADLDELPGPTRFLNHEAMVGMLHFGKDTFQDLPDIAVSEESDLAVLSYYRAGSWDLF